MKILWTFDPFEKNKPLRLLGKKILSNLFSKSDKVTAFYVASHAEISLTTAFDVPKSDRFSVYPKNKIKSELKNLNMKNADVVVLPETSMSTTLSVKKLAGFSKKSKSDLIVCSTHGKSGLSRFFLGSFAEDLVHFSETDLLLYNQKTKLNKKPKTLVYAHDFSNKGTTGLLKVIDYAKKWDASIVVVHAPKPHYSLIFKDLDKSAEPYHRYVNNKAIETEELIRKNKIDCKMFLAANWKKSESELILNVAKKVNADIIFASAKKGRLAAALGGSVTRSIVRNSPIPTLVLKV